MNKETIKELEYNGALKVVAIGALAIKEDITFMEALKRIDAMVEEVKHPTEMQAEFEAAMDAEFNC